MTRIAAVAPELPAHSYSQQEIIEVMGPLLSPDPKRRALIERMYSSSTVERRYSALPLERYRDLGGLTASNAEWVRVATELGERAVRAALDAAGLRPEDVDLLLFTSVTGVAAPSVDALVAERLGMRSDLRRWPSFGLGCVAGAAGLGRAHDFLEHRPHGVVVLLAVELCSLTLQRTDDSMANFVASGLFGDGAAAVALVGDEHPAAAGPRIAATRSATYPDSTDVIGFLVGGTGFEIVLSPGVADVIEEHFPSDVAAFLSDNRLTLSDIDTWIAHPGGPKVLDAFANSLGIEHDEFALSWASLERVGNLSSAAVLHVLADTLATDGPREHGLLFALGPGVSAEFVLLEWS